jgi:hypothetical protein
MHSVFLPDLKILLETTRPTSLLLIDPDPGALPAEALVLCPNCQITTLQDDVLTRLQKLGCFDLAIVANTVEHLDLKTAGILLARLRDLQTRRFVVLVPIGIGWEQHRSHWENTDLLSYGMTLMKRYRVDGKPLHLYHYAIASYKFTPDWFNSKHWAHPERWKP